jgi:hypothetical protein
MYSHKRSSFHIWSSFISSSVHGTLLFFGFNGACNSHPLIEKKVRLALGGKDKHVLLVDPNVDDIENGLLAKPMFKPDGLIKAQFVGPMYFHALPLEAVGRVNLDCEEISLTIGDTQGLEEPKNAWNLLIKMKGIENTTTQMPASGQSDMADSNHTDDDDWTHLHHAAWCCDDAAVNGLADKDANLDVMDSEGRTPLHYAAERDVGAPPTLALAYALGEFLKNSDFALLYLSIFTSNSKTITSLPRNTRE